MRTVWLALIIYFAVVAVAEAKRQPPPQPSAQVVASEGGDLFATFRTSMGDIIVKLYEKEAPKTVDNFVSLATGKKEWKHPATGKWERVPLYDGTAFHRVIPRFMVQGGDPYTRADGDPRQAGRGGPGYRFEDEVDNGKRFNRGGLLAMANSGPNTNGSQFFITEVATAHLDGKHTIFGEVVSGIELIPKIAAAGNMEVKLDKVTITRGKLLESNAQRKSSRKR